MMGNKVNPNAFRASLFKNWNSSWIELDEKKFIDNVHEDYLVRYVVNDFYFGRPISSLHIERIGTELAVNIYSPRMTLLIGKRGILVTQLKQKLEQISLSTSIHITILPGTVCSSRYIADSLAYSLSKRISFKKIVYGLIKQINTESPLGYRIQIKGRIDGSEKTKLMKFSEGKLPLQSIKYDIDYYFKESKTKYGIIGVKCWICRGVLP